MVPLYGEVTHIAKLSTTSWNTRQGAERDLGVELRGHDTDGPVAAAGHRGLDELVEHQPVGDAVSLAAALAPPLTISAGEAFPSLGCSRSG